MVDPEFLKRHLPIVDQRICQSDGGSIDLSGMSIDSDTAPLVFGWLVASLPHLASLNLSRNKIGRAGAVALSRAIKAGQLSHLTELVLTGNEIGEEGVAAIAMAIAEKLPLLTMLDLGDNQIDDEGACHFSRLIVSCRLMSLEFLNLMTNGITDIGAVSLASALMTGHLGNLKTLILSGDSDWTNSNVTRLFDDNLIGDSGAIAIANALENGCLPKLCKLVMGDGQIGDTGAKAIASALASGKLPFLNTLVLSCHQIGDSGAVAIVNGLKQPATINLCSNSISQAGGHLIAQSIRNGSSQLKYLHMNGNNLDVDVAVLDSGNPQQIANAILSGVTLRQGRVMFLGTGEVGKTWLAERTFLDKLSTKKERLREETWDFNFVKAQRNLWPQVEINGRMEAIEPSIWDFAGQLITHGVHEKFLGDRPGSSRTVYVLVLSATHFPGSQREPVSGEEIGNAIEYWLKTLARHAGPNAPVVIAITQCDERERCIDHEFELIGCATDKGRANGPVLRMRISDPSLDLDAVFGQLGVWVTSIVDHCSASVIDMHGKPPEDRSIVPLRGAINDAMGRLTEILEAKVPPQFPKVKSAVEAGLARKTTLTVEEFGKLCVDAGDAEATDFYLSTLDHMGSIFYFGRTERERDRLADDEFAHGLKWRERVNETHRPSILKQYVLNPAWFKQIIYTIVRGKQSLLHEANLRSLISKSVLEFRDTTAPLTNHEFQIVREFMEWTELCFYLREERDGAIWMFPSGYALGEVIGSDAWEKCTLKWEFLPDAAFHRFVVRIHHKMSRGRLRVIQDGYGRWQQWRYAVYLEYAEVRACIKADCVLEILEVRFDPSSPRDGRKHLIEMVRREFEEEILEKMAVREVWSEVADEEASSVPMSNPLIPNNTKSGRFPSNGTDVVCHSEGVVGVPEFDGGIAAKEQEPIELERSAAEERSNGDAWTESDLENVGKFFTTVTERLKSGRTTKRGKAESESRHDINRRIAFWQCLASEWLGSRQIADQAIHSAFVSWSRIHKKVETLSQILSKPEVFALSLKNLNRTVEKAWKKVLEIHGIAGLACETERKTDPSKEFEGTYTIHVNIRSFRTWKSTESDNEVEKSQED